AELLKAWLMQLAPDGKSIARSVREHVGITESAPPVKDDVEKALAGLALDAYPGFLLPPDPFVPPTMEPFSIHVTPLIHRHPQSKAFVEAALRDPLLGKVFEA